MSPALIGSDSVTDLDHLQLRRLLWHTSTIFEST